MKFRLASFCVFFLMAGGAYAQEVQQKDGLMVEVGAGAMTDSLEEVKMVLLPRFAIVDSHETGERTEYVPVEAVVDLATKKLLSIQINGVTLGSPNITEKSDASGTLLRFAQEEIAGFGQTFELGLTSVAFDRRVYQTEAAKIALSVVIPLLQTGDISLERFAGVEEFESISMGTAADIELGSKISLLDGRVTIDASTELFGSRLTGMEVLLWEGEQVCGEPYTVTEFRRDSEGRVVETIRKTVRDCKTPREYARGVGSFKRSRVNVAANLSKEFTLFANFRSYQVEMNHKLDEYDFEDNSFRLTVGGSFRFPIGSPL